jgi:hypothetical protein
MPVALGEQDVARFEAAALAISLEKRDLPFVQRWKNLMMAAAACEQVVDLARGVVAHGAVPDERARRAPLSLISKIFRSTRKDARVMLLKYRALIEG